MAISQTSSSNVASSDIEKRLKMQYLPEPIPEVSAVGSDVVRGLTQTPKVLQPRYLYDDKGSELFEQICELPEYYVTRTEASILQKNASEIAQMTGACDLVELGSGSSTKTRILLDAYKKQNLPLQYLSVDVSAGILESSARQLLHDYPSLQVHALAGTYQSALAQLPPKELPSRMICIIGSTLGNLSPDLCDAFLTQIRDALQEGDYFLLGTDLQKPKHILEAAYNDSQGVTAAFNLNMLEHLNRRFDANFDVSQFEHWAFYNETEHRIEMHIRALKPQTVELSALNLKVNFTQGETIRSEISRKFDTNSIKQMVQSKGFVTEKIWTDVNNWFALTLCKLK